MNKEIVVGGIIVGDYVVCIDAGEVVCINASGRAARDLEEGKIYRVASKELDMPYRITLHGVEGEYFEQRFRIVETLRTDGVNVELINVLQELLGY